MVGALHEMALAPEGDLAWSCDSDLACLGALNESAYGFDSPAFRPAFALAPTSPSIRIYIARMAGEPASGLCVHDEPDGTLGVSAVATLPAARGRGLASRLLAVALREARGRGLTHTALVASSAGRGVYARLGYLDAGVREMWEKRQ
jgi:GNAT superfamily N-acetyltransferase